MVHLVLTALGAVAVETQGLVGHQLLAARVDSSTNGNSKDEADREQLGGHTLELAQTLGDSVGCRRMVSSMAVPIKVKPC